MIYLQLSVPSKHFLFNIFARNLKNLLQVINLLNTVFKVIF